MNDRGWVKCHRQQFDHWVSTDKPYCRGYAWTHLYANANHKDNKICFEGRVVVVKRGEFITSIAKLAEIWGWSRHKVGDFLDKLEMEGMIGQKRTSKYTRIIIVNYEKYQNNDTGKGIVRTSRGHRRDTNKNDKNDKKYRDPMLDP